VEGEILDKMKIEKTAFWKRLVQTQRFIMIITSVLAVTLVFVGVIMRYVLKKDFYGAEEIITVVAMWLYYIAGVYATYKKDHIKADIMHTFVSNKRALAIIDIMVGIITSIVLACFAVWGVQFTLWGLQRGALTPALKIPLTVSQIPLTIGFFLMFFYTVCDTIKQLKNRKNAHTANGDVQKGE
jgi:TRAP-type C4-dicarboxylate transport system permease small subunit